MTTKPKAAAAVKKRNPLDLRASSKLGKAIKGLSSYTDRSIAKMTEYYDTIFAEGMRFTDCISPKSDGSTATPESWKELRYLVVAGMPAERRELLATPTKDIPTQALKDKKRKFQQAIGSRIKDIRLALLERDDSPKAKRVKAKAAKKKADKAKEKADSGKSPQTKMLEALNEVRKLVEQTEDLPFNAANALKLVDELQTVVTGHHK